MLSRAVSLTQRRGIDGVRTRGAGRWQSVRRSSTGASSGIGLAIAKVLGEEGFV